MYETPVVHVSSKFCTVCVFYADFLGYFVLVCMIWSDIVRFAALVINTCKEIMNDFVECIIINQNCL